MRRRASNVANQANADPPPSYRVSGHPATKAVMQRHMETINRLKSAGKALQQDEDNLITLIDVYDTLPLRPNGILEGENWDAVDPMKPLGQPVGKRFVRTDYAGYIVGFDHRREGGSCLVRYEDGDLLHFPARELDTYRNYYVHMQNCAPLPERAQEHGNVLFAGFTPVPNTYAATVKQAGGFIFLDQLSRETHLFQLRDNRLPISVPARNTHCLIVNTTKLVLSLCPLFPQGSNERETLRQFVHFLPQLLHAAGLRHQDVESSSAVIECFLGQGGGHSSKEQIFQRHKSSKIFSQLPSAWCNRHRWLARARAYSLFVCEQ